MESMESLQSLLPGLGWMYHAGRIKIPIEYDDRVLSAIRDDTGEETKNLIDFIKSQNKKLVFNYIFKNGRTWITIHEGGWHVYPVKFYRRPPQLNLDRVVIIEVDLKEIKSSEFNKFSKKHLKIENGEVFCSQIEEMVENMPITMKICKFCGTPFDPRGNKIFCDTRCKAKYNKYSKTKAELLAERERKRNSPDFKETRGRPRKVISSAPSQPATT